MVMSWDFMVIHGDFIIVFIYKKGSNTCKSSWPLGEFSQIMSKCLLLGGIVALFGSFWSYLIWKAMASRMTMTVKKETAQIRPFVVCAILRNVTFDQDRYDAWAVGAVDGISEGGSGHNFCGGSGLRPTNPSETADFNLGHCHCRALKLVGPVGSVGRSSQLPPGELHWASGQAASEHLPTPHPCSWTIHAGSVNVGVNLWAITRKINAYRPKTQLQCPLAQ